MKIPSQKRKVKSKGVIPPRVPGAKEKTGVYAVKEKALHDKAAIENRNK